jgi:hypothetical protein
MFNLHVQCGDKAWIRICIETNADPTHWFYIRYVFDAKVLIRISGLKL